MWPHIHSIHDVYQIVGSLVVGWFAKKVWDWLNHSFWVGFRAGLAAQIKKGGRLTSEELAVVRKQVNDQLTTEFSKKLLKVADVVSDDESAVPPKP